MSAVLQSRCTTTARNPISVFVDAGEMARINPLVRIPSLVLDDGAMLAGVPTVLLTQPSTEYCWFEMCGAAPA